MTYPIFILLGILALALVAIVIVLVSPTASPEEKSLPQGESISVETQGSIVTVRKIGRVTSVSIHDGIRDHWEGPDGVPISPLSPESTRFYYPELYDEYMSSSTSAIRKREIIDEVYAMGFTLPHIPGLYEQYKRELEEAEKDPDGRTANEPTPVNLTPEEPAQPEYRNLEVNRDLAQTSFSPLETEDDTSQDNK